ncbi:MAG: tetratricopeptide repeat protein [Myxococcales bacterium]|nr:tetratricopeptide repeat protein [Myxococcales bacterium]
MLLGVPGVSHAQDDGERLALAARAYEDGLKDFARSQLEGFLASNPKSPSRPEAAYLLGRIYFEQRRWKQAAQAYETAAKGEGDAAVQANYWLAEARRRAGEGDPGAAYEAFVAAGAGDPLEADARYRLGLQRYGEGKWKSAEREFGRCASLKRCSPDARYWQGLAQVQQGQWRSAAATLDAAVPESKALAAERGYWRGLALYRAGDHAGAAKALRAYLSEHDPTHRADAQALLADAYEQIGNWRGARDVYQEFLKDGAEDPRAPAARFGLARATMRLGDAAAARSLFEQIAEGGDPRLAAQALAQICWLDVEAERYADARGRCAEALARSGGKEPTLQFLLAEAAFYQKDWKEAATRYAEVEGVGSFRDEALFKGARSLMALSRYEEAGKKLAALAAEYPKVEPGHVACLRAVVAQTLDEALGKETVAALERCVDRSSAGAPYVEPALWALGVQALKAGEPERARTYLHRLVAEHAESADAPAAHLSLARIAADLGNVAEARDEYAKAAAGADPSVAADAAYALGEMALDAERLDEAAARYHEVVAKAANAPGVREAARLRLGMIAERQGHVDEAVGYYGAVSRDAPQAELRDLAMKRLLLLKPSAGAAKP